MNPSSGCPHTPVCPAADDPAFAQAVVVASHDDLQQWKLLCNGVVVFHDGAMLCPTAAAS